MSADDAIFILQTKENYNGTESYEYRIGYGFVSTFQDLETGSLNLINESDIIYPIFKDSKVYKDHFVATKKAIEEEINREDNLGIGPEHGVLNHLYEQTWSLVEFIYYRT